MKKHLVVLSMLISFNAASISSPALAAAASAPAKKEGKATKEVKTTKKAKKKKSVGKADFSALNFLPFGVGQFVQGRPLMGAVLGGGQAAMLFLYMDRKNQISASNKDAQATIDDIKARGESDEDTDNYLKRNSDYVKKTETEATLCLLGFVGLYGASVVEAVWDPFGSRRSAEKKVSELNEMEDGANKWAKQEELDRLQTKGRFSMFALPTVERSNSLFGISFEKKFR
jgi:multidrug efflux pump subunit AcrB